MALLLFISLNVLIFVHVNTAQDPIGILREEFTLKMQNLQDEVTKAVSEVEIARSEVKAAKADAQDAKAEAKAATADLSAAKEDAKVAKADAIAAKEDALAAKQDALAAKQDAKVAKEYAKAAKEEANAAKEDAKVAKEDSKAAKEDAKAAREEATIANFRAEQALREAESYSRIMEGEPSHLREKRQLYPGVRMLLQVIAPASCSAWKKLGFRTSDNYPVDPDGNGIGESFFLVYCDMDKGLTHLFHKSEMPQKADKCSGPKCYTGNIDYYASDKQIAALRLVSGSCTQKVKIDCLESPLQVGSEPLATWTDSLGVEHEYWTGSVEGHMCDCGVSNSCVNTQYSCNCDSQMKNTMLTDEGHLSGKHALPVRAMHFGSEPSTTLQINFTVGPLICTDRPPVDEVLTCEELFVSGRRTSRVYLLPSETSNDQIDAVFCNMSDVLLNPRKKERKSVDLSDYVQLQERDQQIEEMINKTKQQIEEQIRKLEGKVEELQAVSQGYKKLNGSESYIKVVIQEGEWKDWEAARAACLAEDPYGRTDLVKVDSQQKSDAVWKVLETHRPTYWWAWIGLKQQDRWRYKWSQGGDVVAVTGQLYSDGTNGSYQNWRDAETMDRDEHDNQDCVGMWYYSGKWEDDFCTRPQPYVCEFTP